MRLALEIVSLLSRNFPCQRGRWRIETIAARLIKSVPAFGAQRTIRTRHGFRMEVDTRDEIGAVIFARGEWEPGCTRVAKALLTPGSLFVDVGAHSGYYSILASRQVGPDGRVLCFEPIATNRRQLCHNLTLNHIVNCTVRAEALWSTSATLKLHLVTGNSGMATIRQSRSPDAAEDAEAVSAVTLDSLADDLAAIALVKVDVEGAEYEVLRGMDAVLKRYRPNLIVEIVEAFQKEVGTSAAEIVAFLAAYGYQMYVIEWEGGLRSASAHYAEVCHQFEAFFTAHELPASLRKHLVLDA